MPACLNHSAMYSAVPPTTDTAQQPEVSALLKHPLNAEARPRGNRCLEAVNTRTGSAALYALNADGQVRCFFGHDAQLVVGRHGGDRMGNIGAAHPFDAPFAARQRIEAIEIAAARGGTALADAVGDRGKGFVHGRDRLRCNSVN